MPLGSLRFRARAAMTARQRRQAWWYAQTLYELMASMAAQTEYPMPRLPRLDGDPVVAAQRTREVWNLPARPPCQPLIRTLERHGVWVLAAPTPAPAGRLLRHKRAGTTTTPVIVVAAAAGDRRRFSVAHARASGLPVPEGSPRTRWSGRRTRSPRPSSCPQGRCAGRSCPRSPSPLWRSSRARWVSLQALIRRALTLELTSPSQYRSLSAQLGARGWRTREPVAVPVERPRALRQLAELLYGIPIDYSSLAHATSLDPAFVRNSWKLTLWGTDGPHRGAQA